MVMAAELIVIPDYEMQKSKEDGKEERGTSFSFKVEEIEDGVAFINIWKIVNKKEDKG